MGDCVGVSISQDLPDGIWYALDVLVRLSSEDGYAHQKHDDEEAKEGRQRGVGKSKSPRLRLNIPIWEGGKFFRK